MLWLSMERKGLEIRKGSGKVTTAPGPPRVRRVRNKREWPYVLMAQGTLGSYLLPQFIYGLMFGQILQISGKNDAYFYSKRGSFLSNKFFDHPGHGTGSLFMEKQM